jgi:hypothetical protein
MISTWALSLITNIKHRAFTNLCNVSTGVSDRLGILLPRSENALSPLVRQGVTGVPTTTPILTDGMDMTAHSKQERENCALTQYDPGHSTTTTSIPLQRWG